MNRSTKQASFTFKTWGGTRKGAGRKKGPRPPIPHRARPPLPSRFPVHVTLKVAKDLPNLRRSDLFEVVRLCLVRGKERFGFRVVHFSVQGSHIHLLCEAKSKEALTRGAKGLCVRLARRLNARLGRTGQVFPERYHAHILRTPTEVHRCLVYVLLNARRHAAQQGRKLPGNYLDPLSSAYHYNGWLGRNVMPTPGRAPPVVSPHTWLLREGWRQVERFIPPEGGAKHLATWSS